MKRILLGLGVVALLGIVAVALVAQYVTQVPARRAIVEMIRQRHINPPPMGQTALGFIGRPTPQSFGPVGPTADPGRACYDEKGRPLVREDAADPAALCGVTYRRVPVADAPSLASALVGARMGDVIELAAGDYDLAGNGVKIGGAGTPQAPIVVRAAKLGDVRLRLSTIEGFAVNQPYWVFENLIITGTCANDNDCEHAFHVTGPAVGTIIRNNRLRNFNAAIKINRDASGVPDDMLVERNLIFNATPRETKNPVTPIDAVAADRLHVVANVIADFAKNGGDRTSYGAFAKGGGSGALMERNLVMCEWRHRGGNRVGLSLGGGGTGEGLCRTGACGFEQRGGVVRANIIANCADAGIYLRNAPDSRVENNLVYATRGIEGRFADTRATIVNNIVDGRLIGWAGATLNEASNLSSRWRAATLGRVSEGVLADPRRGDMAFRSESDSARRGLAVEGKPRDFCGAFYDPAAPPIGPIEQRGANCASKLKGIR